MNYRKIQEVLGLMQKNLECSICLDLLKNPVSTKCDHPFCRFCITEFLKTKKSVPCPLCKNAITKRSLNERPQLSEIVENVCRLMNAMQTDTGQAYSPPKGPQAMHFFSCTPERLPYKENRGTKRKISLSDKKELSRGRNTRNSKKRKSMNDVDDTVVSLDFLNNSNNTHTVTKQQNVGQNSEITMGMEHEKNAEKITTSTRTRPGIQMHGEECGPDSKRGKRNSKIENEKRNGKNNSGINVFAVVEKDSNKKLRTGRSKVQVKCSNHTDNLLQYLETGSCGAVGEESSVCSSIELNKNVRTGVLDQERLQSGEHLPNVKGQLRHGERTPICSSVVNINRCLNDFQENGNVNDQLECHNGVLGDEVRETDCNVNHLPHNSDVQSCGGQESLSSTPVHIPVVTRTYSSAHRKAHASKDAKSTFKVKNWLQNIEKMNDNQCADEVESLRVSQEAGNGNIMDNVILGGNESAGKEKSASLWEQEVKETKINLGAEKTLTGVTKAEITEPDQVQTKHRIFKCTRNDSHTVTETSTSQKKGKLVFKKIIPKAVIETSEATATDKQITDRRKTESKQNLMIRGNVNNELNLSGQESDPYEFKSSQLTPTVKKNNKKRDLHGKSRKLGQISLETQKIKSAKRKNVDAKLKPQESQECDLTVQHETDVIIVEDERAIGTKNNVQQMKSLGCLVIKTTDKKKMAGQKLSPKLLQLQKESEEFEKMKDSIHEAEDYDLLTSTQEVQEHLTKDQQESPVFDMIPDTLEDTNVVGKCFRNKKSVRFNDEVITIENLSQQGKAELASDKAILGVSDMILQSNCKGRLQIQEGKDKSDSSVSVSGRVDNDNVENKSKKSKSGLISKLNDSRQCQLESQNDGDKFRHGKLSVQEAKQSKGIDDQVDKHGDENLVKQNDVGSVSLLNQDDKSGHHGLMNQEVKIQVSGVHSEKHGFGEEKNQDSKLGNGDFHNMAEKPGQKDLQNLDEEPGCEDLQNQDAESGLQTLQGENDIEHHKSLAQDEPISFQGNVYQVVSHLPTQDEMVIHESMECDDVMKQTFEGEASISEKHLPASETKGNDVVCEAHVDDETSSTATEDLNVEPREQDFEQVNLDIQPVGILEKLQSQDSERNSMICSNSQTEEQTALSSGPKHHPKQLNKEHSSEVNVCKSNSADENIVLDTPGCENINRVTVKLHKGRTPKKFVEEKIPGNTETLVINDGGHSERNSLTNSCTSTDVTENLEDTIRRKTRKSRRKPNKVCNYSESTQSECDVDNIDNTHRSVVGKQKISTENFNCENLRKTRKPRLKRPKNCSQNEMTEEGSFPDISVVEVVRETQRSQSISIDTDSAQGSVSILAPVQHRVPRHGPLSVNSDMDSTQESVSILKPFSGHHTRPRETSVIHNSTQQHPSDLSIDGKECNVSVTTEGHDNSDKISASFESCSGQVLDICLKKPKRKSFALESSVSATLSESEKTKPCSLGNLQDMKNGHSDLQSLFEVPESANLKENSEIVEENVIDRSATVTSYTQNKEHCEEGSIDELCGMEHKKGQSSSLRSNDRKIIPDSLTWGRNAKSADLSQELVASECQVGNSEFDTPVVGKNAANTCDSDNAKFCGKVDSVSAVNHDNKINDFGKDDDDDADDDDLTPTLLSVRQLRKKDKNDRSVLCSQEDIFLMDSETPDSYRDEANEIELIQNQEGNMDLEYGLVHSDIESERGSQVSQKQVQEKILASEDIDSDVMINQISNSLETDNDVQKCTSFAINKASSKQEVEAKSISQITSDQSCRNQNRKCDVAMILDDCVKSAWCKASNRSSPKRSELSEKLTSATRSGKNLISEESLHVCSVKEESNIPAGSGGTKMHQVSKSGVGGDINVQRDSVHDVMDFQSSVTAHNEPHNNKLSCGSQESNNTENCKAVIHDVKMVDTDSANYQRMTSRASSTKQDSLKGVQTSDRHRITQSPVEKKRTTDIDLLPTSSPLPDVIGGYISDNHMSQDDETVPPSAINDVNKSDVEDEDDNDDAILITRRCPAEMYENVDDSKDEDEKRTPDPQLSLPTENGCQQDIALPRNEVKSLKKENNTDNTDSEDSESSELILSPVINEDERFGDLKDTSEEEEDDIGFGDNNDDLDDSTVVRRKRVRPLIVVDDDEDDNNDELEGRKLNCLRSKAKLIETDDNVEVISVKDTNDECLCLDEEEEADEDDDEEDYIVRKKKSKSLVIEDEDNSEGDVASQDSSLSHQMNLTSSSAFSSQSEAMSTQHQKKMELDLERMRREIAELEAKISASKKLSDGESFRNKKESKKEDRRKKGKKDKVNGDIVTSRGSDVCKSSNTSESDKSDTDNIEHYESAEESDDLFLSPPPPTPPPFDADISMEQHHTVDLPEDIQETDKFLQQFRKGGGKSSLVQAEINADETIEATFQDTSSFPKTNRQSTDLRHKRDIYRDECISNIYSQSETVKKSPLSFLSKPQKIKRNGGKNQDENVLSGACETISAVAKPRERTVLSSVVENEKESTVRHIGFVATGLAYIQLRELQKLAQVNTCKVYSKFAYPEVTHIITKTDPTGGRVCDRTLKFFQGVAHGCWILDYQWVLDCRAANRLLPEDKYEIIGDTVTGENHHGPKKSRLCRRKNLFQNVQFYIIGSSKGLSPDDLKGLVLASGGIIVPDPKKFTSDRSSLIVTCSDVDEDEEDNPSSQDIKLFNKLYREYDVLTVSREWVLDSLTLYEVQQLKDYILTCVKGMVIKDIHT